MADAPTQGQAEEAPVTRRVRLLVVEDSEVDARLVLHELRRAGYEPEHARVDSAAAMAAALAAGGWDAVLCDYELPGFGGEEAVRLFQGSGLDVPFIIVAGTIEDRRAAQLMALGARDFVSKGSLGRLGAVLDRELREAGDRRARAAVQRELEALRERERQREVFLGAASHEIRNPLTPIKTHVFLLSKRAKVWTDEEREWLNIIARNVDRVAALTADMLDVTRLQAGKMALQAARVDLRGLLAEAAAAFEASAREAGIRLEAEVGERLEVDADAGRIGQVVYNLLSNALKFTPPGGTVRLRAWREGREARVEVRDSGAGMPAEALPRLFQPFSQVHRPGPDAPKGTGLGLSICRGIVELHGGRIWAESGGLGQGSTFTIALPCAAGAGRAPSAAGAGDGAAAAR